MTNSRIFCTDKEVAAILEISQSTLSRIMSGFRRGGKLRGTSGNELDIAAARPMVVGGYRRWKISSLADALGITRDELLEKLS